MRKKSFIVLLCSLVLVSGCVVTLPTGEGEGGVVGIKPISVGKVPYKLDDKHWSDVAKIKSEAEKLSLKIGSGEVTKVEAARQLGNYRIQLVGSNVVDDDVYRIYLNAAVDSNDGKISNAQSKNLVKNALTGWQKRWENMDDSQKPTNPAFTNFLNETVGLPYLK